MCTYRREVGPELGSALRSARGAKSLRATARRVGVAPGYLSMLERGERAPSGAVLAALEAELPTLCRFHGIDALREIAAGVDRDRRERAMAGGYQVRRAQRFR